MCIHISYIHIEREREQEREQERERRREKERKPQREREKERDVPIFINKAASSFNEPLSLFRSHVPRLAACRRTYTHVTKLTCNVTSRDTLNVLIDLAYGPGSVRKI